MFCFYVVNMHHMPSHGGKCVLVFFLCFLMFHLYLFVLCLSLALCPLILLMSSLFFFREPFCLATSTRVRTFGAPSFPGHDVLHASENPGFAKKSNQPIHNMLTTSSHMFTKFANFLWTWEWTKRRCYTSLPARTSCVQSLRVRGIKYFAWKSTTQKAAQKPRNAWP